MRVRVASRNKRQRNEEPGAEDMAVEDGPRLREALGGESSEDEDAEMDAKLRAAALATVAGLDEANKSQQVEQVAVLIEVVVAAAMCQASPEQPEPAPRARYEPYPGGQRGSWVRATRG